MPTEADYRLADEWLAPYLDIRAMPSREIARERLAEKRALARDGALEEAAGLCELSAEIMQPDERRLSDAIAAVKSCAAAIRKLKDKRDE